MKKILLYSGKHNYAAWDASTKELEEQAMSKLFNYLDEVYSYYDDLKEMQSLLYKKAKEGDAKSIYTVLSMRRSYEYEYWEFLLVCE